MAFGQQSGPPASHRQVQHLRELLVAAGHSDFRDARGPLGLTQRQGGGKFTRDEADELIALLEAELDGDLHGEAAAQGESDTAPAGADTRAAGDGPRESAPLSPGANADADAPAADAPSPALAAAVARRNDEMARNLRNVPDDVLAAELQRRGWAVLQP